MPVRGTTRWAHAIINKKVINLDHAGDRHVMCAWDTCERDGLEVHKVRVKTHSDQFAGDPRNLRYMNYVFCSERHKLYFVNSLRDCNNLPAGARLTIL